VKKNPALTPEYRLALLLFKCASQLLNPFRKIVEKIIPSFFFKKAELHLKLTARHCFRRSKCTFKTRLQGQYMPLKHLFVAIIFSQQM
jgi:hypothetical protein